MLDDVRPYPQEEDFSFHDEDDGIVLDDEKESGDAKEDEGTKKTVEASGFGKGAVEDSHLSDDEVEFAYKPSDPRYFVNGPYTGTYNKIIRQPTLYVFHNSFVKKCGCN